MTTKKQPRWTIAFLRALERCGDVRASAEDAGIDHSTAYARRRSHSDFAAAWDGALAAHAAGVKAREAGALAFFVKPHPTPNPSPSRGGESGREELVGSAAQLKRAGHDRWSGRKEKLFFDELAATANVKRAAAAAGVSPNAVYARRLKQPLFRAKWEAVLETGRAAIETKLIEAANRSFDPDEIDTGDVQPRVSVAEAIRIVQAHGSKKEREAQQSFLAEQAAAMTPDDISAMQERLMNKLNRMRQRDMPDKLAAGWSYDEAHDHMVPPGWVRAG